MKILTTLALVAAVAVAACGDAPADDPSAPARAEPAAPSDETGSNDFADPAYDGADESSIPRAGLVEFPGDDPGGQLDAPAFPNAAPTA